MAAQFLLRRREIDVADKISWIDRRSLPQPNDGNVEGREHRLITARGGGHDGAMVSIAPQRNDDIASMKLRIQAVLWRAHLRQVGRELPRPIQIAHHYYACVFAVTLGSDPAQHMR